MKNVLKYSIFSILLIALFISCEIGLGNSVDTEVPVQEIKTPNPATVAVIRGDFPIIGNWSDDGTIDFVTVTIKNDTSTVFEGNASVNTSGSGEGTWSCKVSPRENGIKDGSYYVSVKIQDTAGHSSIASSQIVIDNTPPVIVLSHPSTIAGDTSLDTYGTVFSLNGQAADDNGVDLIEVNVFSDAAKQNKLHTIELKNVPNTIKLKAAEFEEGENNDYAKIYGSTMSDGERSRYCTIVAYDGAQRYPTDGSAQSAADKKGNATSVYYLSENEAISQLISEYKVTGLYQMMAGTYSEGNSARTVSGNPLAILKANEIGLGAFALDPENNPKFIVTSKYEMSNGISREDAKLINNSSLVVEVAPGLDGSPIKASSLKVYAVRCDANGNVLDNTHLYPSSTSPVTVGSSYQIAVTFSAGKIEDGKFKTNEYYKLGVEGTDDNGKSIIPSVRKGYGFYFTTSGILPTVEVASPSDDDVFKTGDNVTVEGTVSFIEDGVFSLDLIDESGAKTSLVSQVADDNGVPDTDLTPGKLSYTKVTGQDRKYHFKYIIPASKFDQSVTKSYTISFPNPNADTSIKYDAQKPTVELKFTGTADDNNQLGPLARKFADGETLAYADNVNYVNGTFTFEYKVKDEDNGSGVNLDAKKPEVKVYEEGITEPKLTQTLNAETKTVSVDTDTLGFNDGRNVRVVVTAYDKSGNKTEKTESYKLDKSTDLPRIYPVQQTGSKPLTFTKKTKASVENQNEYNTLVADDPSFKLKFFDDDGLVGKALFVSVDFDKDGNETDVENTTVECVPDENGAEETFTIPKATSGFYKITVTAKDKVGDNDSVRKTTSKEFWVRITPSAPSVRIKDLSSRYVTNSTSANNKTSSAITKLEPEVIIDSTEKPFRITRKVIYKDTNTEKESFKAFGSLTSIDVSDSRLTANTDGTYTYKDTYTPPSNFAAGEYSIAYKVYDSNGNSSSASETDPAVFFIDNLYEIINKENIIVPADTDNAGASFTFKVNDVTAQGAAPLTYKWAFTEASVTSSPVESAFATTSNQNYKFTYPTSPAWSQGKKKLWVYTVDAAGNKSNVQSKEFYYDLAKPVVSFQEASFDTKQVFSLHVNASDTWALDSLELFKVVGTESVSTGKTKASIASTSTNWEITSLPAATIAADTFEEYKYFVRAKDKAGKASDSSTITVRVDNKKPEISDVKFGSENTNILNGSLGEIKITSKDTGLGLKELHYTITKTSGTNTTTLAEDTINLAGAGETTTIISKELGTGKDLPEGKYTLSCDVKDLADNSYSAAAKEFYVDLAAPELSDVKIQAGSDSAEEITEGAIKYLNTASNLILTGKITESNGFVNSGLVVKIGDTTINKSNITVSGTAPNYTFAVSNIVIPENDKEVSIKVTASDIAGQPSEKNYTIWNDRKKPEITFITPDKSATYEGNNSISGAKYNFNISLSDTGSKLNTLKYCIKPWTGNTEPSAGTGDWTDVTTDSAITGKLSSAYAFEKTLKASGNTGAGDLAEGHYTLFVYVEDSVGNSKTDKVSFWIDQAAPSLTCSAITPTRDQTIDGYVVSNVDPTLTINASDTNVLASVTVTKDGVETSEYEPLSLSEGKHKIVITAKDSAGREKQVERLVWKDSKAPTGTFDIETPVHTDSSANKWYNDSYITLSLTNVKDEGGSGIYQVLASSDNTNSYPLSLNETPANSGIYTSGGKINCTAQGENSVKVTIVDNAGNIIEQRYPVYIDTDAPNHAEIKEVKVGSKTEVNSGTVLVNKKENMTLKLEARDAASGSGIKSVAVKNISETKVTTKGSDGYYSITIPKAKLSSGALVFEVIDYVDNKYEYISDLVIDVDIEPPAVSIDPVTDADPDTAVVDVNGIFTLSGSSSDNNSVASIKLEYKIASDGWTEYKTLTTGLDDWSIAIDTTRDIKFKDVDKKNVTFRATATDAAQNTKESAEKTVYINQASDLPVITFTDFDVSEMSAANPLLSESKNIYCSVYDDDGDVTLGINKDGSKDENNKLVYTSVTPTNGSFTLTLNDGTYDSSDKPAIKFQVQDSVASEAITNPRIKGMIISGSKTTSTLSELYIKVDTEPPVLSEEKYKKTWETPVVLDTSFSSLTLGGTRDTLTIQIKAEDANPIKSVKATFKPESNNPTDYFTFAESETTSVYEGEISVAGLSSGQNKLIIIASDGINESEKEISLTVDNTAPDITVDSHVSGELIHKDFVLQGGIDGDTETKLYYKITKPDAQITKPAGPITETSLDAGGWNPVTGNSTLRWKIYFDKTAAVTNQEGQDCHDLLPKYLIAREYPSKVAIGSDGIAYAKVNGVVTSTKYVHNEIFNFNFFAVDEIGNISEVTTIPLELDPQGDIPNIVLEYPATDALVSGVIRLSGSAEFVNEPKALYMQIDPDYDGTSFATDWENKVFPNEKKFSNYTEYSDIRYLVGSSGERGIYIGNSLSWSKTINLKSEFEPVSDSTNDIAIRLYAVDEKNNISSTEDKIYVLQVNAGAPKIGSSEPLLLKQFDNAGNVTKVMNYKDDMWIKGVWYLTGSVEDDDGIYTITVTDETTNPATTVVNAYDPTEVTSGWTYAGKTTKGYRLKIPVGSDTGARKLKFKISANDGDANTEDKDRHSTEMNISINYDNNAPEIAESTSNDYKINAAIYNQNGKNYSIESVATEPNGESGFLRTVYYFTAENGKVYDSTWTAVNGSKDNTDDLYWKTNTASNISGSEVTLATADTEINAGSLAKIGGTIYSISSVNTTGTKVVLDSAPDESLKNKPIYFVLGTVVPKKGITTMGTKTRWTNDFDSTKLPDGAVKLTYVVFDKAGNHTPEAIDALVKNNAPRLASVKIGTDYNGNGTIEPKEYKISYCSSNTRWFMDENNKLSSQEKALDGIRDSFEITGENGAPFTTVHSAVKFMPEIIGGNTPETTDYLEYSKGSAADNNTRTSINKKALGESAYKKTDYYGQSYVEGVQAEIICSFDDLADGASWYTYTIWDKTPGSKQLSVTFTARLNAIKSDTAKPSVKIDDFFWTSSEENSLYRNSKANGHIDLSEDLPSADFNPTKGTADAEFDTDPKVSGKITVRGYVKDNVRIGEVKVKIPGFLGSDSNYVSVATYSNGKWTMVSADEGTNMQTNHWTFDIEDEYNNEKGHKANWEFSWDTSYITGVAAKNVKVYVQAIDEKPDGATAQDSDGNTLNENTPYQMDVVPYITSVVTSLGDGASNINARTARGHYPEQSGKTLKLNGFNLAQGNAQVTDVTLPATSGNLEYTVNTNVISLNNKNSKTAEYNQQPNNKNNNTLTDDVVIDVWEFDSEAVVPKKGSIDQPIMKINPVTDKIGFAFADGPLNFNMGGRTNGSNKGKDNSTGTPTEYSYHTWLAGYDAYSSIAFTYDSLGNSYGVAAGGDISATNSTDKLLFFTGRWGNACFDNQGAGKGSGSYNGNGRDWCKLRLSQIGQNNAGTNVQDKQRHQSTSLATTVSGTSTNVYLAYYDAMNKQIRFKAGTISSTAFVETANNNEFGDFVDSASADNPVNYATGTVYLDIIAGTGSSKAETYGVGKYVSVGATASAVVITWYDEKHSTLWYAYNESALTEAGVQAPRTGDSWTISRVFAEDSPYAKAGQFVQLAVDAKGGIHIAAYDSVKCNLVYAYKSSYNTANFTSCIVDSYGIVGSNISLDVAMTESGDDGKAIPYIGYYASSNVKPKLATLPEGIASADDVKDGAVEDKFTGEWECSLLPTPSNLQMNSKQYNHINVCSWKDTAGVLKLSSNAEEITGWTKISNNTSLSHTHDTETASAYNTKKFGQVTGNGTNKPILAYNIKNGTAVETAQMK